MTVIFNFDVIARKGEPVGTRQPDPDGRALWSMFFDKYMGRILLVVNEDYPREQLEQWLRTEKFKPSMYEMLDEPLPDLRAQKIQRLAAVFGKPSWYVDSNADVCGETLKLGIPTLLVACPYIVRPEWSSQREIKQWGALVSEMDAQALKASEKTWRE